SLPARADAPQPDGLTHAGRSAAPAIAIHGGPIGDHLDRMNDAGDLFPGLGPCCLAACGAFMVDPDHSTPATEHLLAEGEQRRYLAVVAVVVI
ncbi:MAG: hypothetical protein ACK559_36450, partial [bacterium]